MKKHIIIKLRKTLFQLFLLSYCCLTVNSQSMQLNVPQVMPTPPEMAAMIKYIDYPVDPSTGIPDITIPLYEIKDMDVIIPITLTYHASGLKPRDGSSIMGTGWTLNAEPSVARIINGRPDDEGGKGLIDNDYYKNQHLDNSTRRKEYFEKVANNEMDEEPDTYYFKLLKQKGTYYLSKRANAGRYDKFDYVTHPYQPVRIYHPVVSDNPDLYLKMTDNDGIEYSFGGEDKYLDKLENGTSRYNYRWLCNSLISIKTGTYISFDYTSPQSWTYRYPLDDYFVIEDYKDGNNYVVTDKILKTPGSDEIYIDTKGNLRKIYQSSSANYMTRNVFENYGWKQRLIKTIEFSNGSAHFSYSNNKHHITIKDKNNKTIRFIEMYVTKYNDKTQLTKLDSVRIYIPNSSLEKKVYKFSYIDPFYVPVTWTKAIDHWGYFNASDNDRTSAIPSGIELEGGILKAGNRQSSEGAMQVGVLKKIVDPQGGVTEFYYEANRIGLGYFQNKIREKVGGLRIKSIVERENEGGGYRSHRVYEYGYKKDDRNIFFDYGVPKHYVTEKDYCFEQEKLELTPGNQIDKRRRVRTWSSTPRTIITYSNGCPVIYPYVSETKQTFPKHIGEKQYEQKTVYTYSFPDSYGYITWYLDIDPQYGLAFGESSYRASSLQMPAEADEKKDYFQYGLLLKKEVFEQDTIISKTEYKYGDVGYLNWTKDVVDYKIRFAKRYKTNLVVHKTQLNDEVWSKRQYDVVEYALLNGYNQIIEEKNTLYFYPNGKIPDNVGMYGGNYYFEKSKKDEVVTVKKYTYPYIDKNHMQPVKIETTTPDGKLITDYYTYPEEEMMASAEDLGAKNLIAMNMLQTPVEHKRVQGNESVHTRINFQGGLPLVGKISINGQPFRNQIEYSYYHPRRNISSIKAIGKPETHYLWSYNYQYPVAKIENATKDQITAQLTANWIGGLGLKNSLSSEDIAQLNSLREKLPDSHITTYTYESMKGVSSVTEPNGIATYYQYDDYGRLTESYFMEGSSKRIINTHTYNLGGSWKGDDENVPKYSMAFVRIELENTPVLSSGRHFFDIHVEGGSGNYTYRWKLTRKFNNEDRLVGEKTTTGNSVFFELTEKALYTLSCTVRDNANAEEKSDSKIFYVK